MRKIKIKLSVLVSLSMLLLTSNVASAQGNLAGESTNYQLPDIGTECIPSRCR